MESLVIALGIGLASGVSPGPLLTLVVSTTLERGFAAGLRVASAPILTDAPIIAACYFVLRSVPEIFLTTLAVLGGAFVVYVGVDTLRTARKSPKPSAEAETIGRSKDFLRGILVNFLSPHPWIFWLGVGVPQMLRLAETSRLLAVSWAVLFVVGLVASKVALAWVVARGRRRLEERWYRLLLGGCGALLIVLGVALVAGRLV